MYSGLSSDSTEHHRARKYGLTPDRGEQFHSTLMLTVAMRDWRSPRYTLFVQRSASPCGDLLQLCLKPDPTLRALDLSLVDATRTGRVRLILDNTGGRLKPRRLRHRRVQRRA